MGTMRSTGAGCAALLAVGSFFTVSGSAWASDVFYSGRATGIDGNTSIAGTDQDILVGDTGMSCVGLPHDETVASNTTPSPFKTSVQNVHVHTLGKDGVAAADATMQNLNVQMQGLTITADSVGAHAKASCDISTGKVTPTGHSDFVNLIVNGQATDVRQKQSIQVPNVGYVYFDQHHPTTDQMQVYAIHIRLNNPSLPAQGDVYIGKVRARTICNP